jgi:hypothetical protein
MGALQPVLLGHQVVDAAVQLVVVHLAFPVRSVRWSSRPLYPTPSDVARGATSTSTTRALRVVEAVAAAGDGVTAKVIARRVGVPLPSVCRA